MRFQTIDLPDGAGVPVGVVTGLNFGRPYTETVPNPKYANQTWFADQFQGAIPGNQVGSGTRDWGPSSDHAGGVVISGYADGHAKAISDSIDATAWYRLATRAGGESIADY